MCFRLQARVGGPGTVPIVYRAKVMVAPVISISSDSSDKSVGSHVLRVPIAPVDPLVALEVGAISVISPTEANSESEPAEQRPERVGPFPACILRWRRVSHCSSDRHSSPNFTSDSSSSSSSLDSSSDISSGSSLDSLSESSSVHSSGCDASSQSHSGLSTRVASPRLVDPLIHLLRGYWIHLHLLLDHLARDAEPTLVPLSTPISRSIAPALADLPPRKRFRDSYSFEASGEEHMEIGIAIVETVADLGISDGVGAHTDDDIGMGVEIATSDVREDEEEFEAKATASRDAPDLEGTLYDISHYMSEVPFDRIIKFETAQRQLEAGQLVASEERAGLTNRVRSLGRENLREEFRQIYRDRDDTRWRLRRLKLLVERRLGFHR
ncbi:hypothetical protein Tco_0935829 [Tanacetum coccineum]